MHAHICLRRLGNALEKLCAGKSCARWKGKQCFFTHIILILCLCVACTCARVEQFPPLIVAQRTLRIPEQKKPLLEAAGLVQTSTTKQSAAIAGAARQFASWVRSRRELGCGCVCFGLKLPRRENKIKKIYSERKEVLIYL